MRAVVVTLVALTLLHGSVAAAAAAASATVVSTPPGECLRSSGGSWNVGTGLDTSAQVTFAGCFLTTTLNVTGVSPRVLRNVTFNESAPLNFTVGCGAFCGERFSTGKAVEAQFVPNADGACECILPSSFMTPRAHPNASMPCPPPQGGSPYVRLYEVRRSCPLNTSSCGAVDGCSVIDGCCKQTPNEAPKAAVPHLYVAMMQWTIAVILGIAVIEAVVYTVLRCRRRRMDGSFDDDATVRTKTEASALGERLLSTFPPAPAPTMLNAVDGGDACTICLEDLTTLPSVKLPCAHVLHTHCLREYLNHRLVSRNSVPCPVCRQQIADGADD